MSLREQILSLAKQYKNPQSNEDFTPGVDYVPVSGKVLESHDWWHSWIALWIYG